MTQRLHIVGGGMAGSEAAWQAAQRGIDVVIHEMRPKVETFAHQTGNLGEMVCSNSMSHLISIPFHMPSVTGLSMRSPVARVATDKRERDACRTG